MNKIEEFVLLVQKSVCKVKRTQENDHLKSKYADLEDVLELLNPYFTEHGVLVEQYPTFQDGLGWVYCTKLTAGDEHKEYFHPLLGLETKTPMQSLGSAETYARRYSLKGIFKLVDSDDDANAVTPAGGPSKSARKSEVEKMLRAFAALNVSKSEVESVVQQDAEHFTISDMESLKSVYLAIKGGKKKLADFLNEVPQWQD